MPKSNRQRGWLLAVAAGLLAACSLSPTPDVTPASRTVLSCAQLVSTAVQAAGSVCSRLGRNQICYGYPHVAVAFQAGSAPRFAAAGDVADLLAVRQVNTGRLDEPAQTWGVVLIHAQANLPDLSPEQNLAFVLYGDAALDGLSPVMTAARLETAALSSCPEAPPAALLIQSPPGASVTFSLNGASLTLGSTLYVTAIANEMLTIATLEGTAVVSALGTTRIVRPGAQVRLTLGGDSGLEVSGAPSEPEPLAVTRVQRAPLALLGRPISLPAPLARPSPTAPPSPVPTTAPAEVACVPRPDWTGTHIVQRGEALSTIAQQMQVSLIELQQGNCLANPNRIFPGQTLRVPGAPPPPAALTPPLIPTRGAASDD